MYCTLLFILILPVLEMNVFTLRGMSGQVLAFVCVKELGRDRNYENSLLKILVLLQVGALS